MKGTATFAQSPSAITVRRILVVLSIMAARISRSIRSLASFHDRKASLARNISRFVRSFSV
jgi:hypothetical protein